MREFVITEGFKEFIDDEEENNEDALSVCEVSHNTVNCNRGPSI